MKGHSCNAESNHCICCATIVMMNGLFDIAPIYVLSSDNQADGLS